MGRLRYGRYETLGLIASGGMASVHLGRARGPAGFERLVAIKVMHPHIAGDPEFSSMFLDEARLAAQIRHPNVVPTLDVSEDGRIIVMEYVEGAALSAILRQMQKQGERVPLGCALRIVLDLLDGLHAAHELRGRDGTSLHLVHRDISPHNVLVGVDGVSRITDFGIAYAESRLTSTRGSQLKGKMPYMAPEQLEGAEIDRKVDVYAAGVVLWELLLGKRLFTAENDAALACRVLAGPDRSPREVDGAIPAAIDLACMRALARSERRFPSALAFSEALEAAATEGVVTIARPRSIAALARAAQTTVTPPPSSVQVSMDAQGRVGTTQPGYGEPAQPDEVGGAPGPSDALVTRASDPAGRPAPGSSLGAPSSLPTRTAAPTDEQAAPAARPVAVGPAAAIPPAPAPLVPALVPVEPRPGASPPSASPAASTVLTPVLGSTLPKHAPAGTLRSEDGAGRDSLALSAASRPASSAALAVGSSPSAGIGSPSTGPSVVLEAPASSGPFEAMGTGASLVAPIPGLPRRGVPAWAVAVLLSAFLVGGGAALLVFGSSLLDGGSGPVPRETASGDPPAPTGPASAHSADRSAPPGPSASPDETLSPSAVAPPVGPTAPRSPAVAGSSTGRASATTAPPTTTSATTTGARPTTTAPPTGSPTGTSTVFHPPRL